MVKSVFQWLYNKLINRQVAVSSLHSYYQKTSNDLYATRHLHKTGKNRAANTMVIPKYVVDRWIERYGKIDKVEISVEGEDVIIRPHQG